MISVPLRCALATFCTFSLGCSAAIPTWRSQLHQDHPLVARIWQTVPGRFVTEDVVLSELAAADFVLLGEKHDNADHHLLQARLLQGLIDRGRKPALRLEMVTPDQEPALRAWQAKHPRDASALGTALDWQASGWPEFALYQPIFEVALAAGLDIGAANLNRATVKAVMQHGASALDDATVDRLGLRAPVDETVRDAMAAEIIASHCNQLPRAAADPMAFAQRARDAVMADALLQVPSGGAVLIAGNGHVRRDRAVPEHIRRRAAERTVQVLSLVEVQDGVLTPAAALGTEGITADFLWFTPRVDDEDPCAHFAEQLKRMKSHEPQAQKQK
jgi:uncharacterized iron-regulated protein